jgi:hypothetical protein
MQKPPSRLLAFSSFSSLFQALTDLTDSRASYFHVSVGQAENRPKKTDAPPSGDAV